MYIGASRIKTAVEYGSNSCPKTLFHSEAKCEAVDTKMIFLFSRKLNSFSQERFCI